MRHEAAAIDAEGTRTAGTKRWENREGNARDVQGSCFTVTDGDASRVANSRGSAPTLWARQGAK